MSTNLFADIPADLPEELTQILVSSSAVRIERIVSRGQASPDGFWYCQAQTEFVLLLSGEARLDFAEPASSLKLTAGDWLVIEAGCHHRVAWTSSEKESIWLCVFF